MRLMVEEAAPVSASTEVAPITEETARQVAARGRQAMEDFVREALEARGGRPIRAVYEPADAMFSTGLTVFALADMELRSTEFLARLLGSPMDRVGFWMVPDDVDCWTAAVLKADGQRDAAEKSLAGAR